MFCRVASLALLLSSTAALAEPVTLKLANPQPAASSLKPGLAVTYAYPGEVRTLQAARAALGSGKRGPALSGFSYPDNEEGDMTLTSTKAQKVAAGISGYMRFDEPGLYTITVFGNDGIEVSIGGQQVAFYDGIHACEPAGDTEVNVPTAGWYAIKATYFQRKGTACLEMEWLKGSLASGGKRPSLVPDAVFAHTN